MCEIEMFNYFKKCKQTNIILYIIKYYISFRVLKGRKYSRFETQ